ncbi:MAG: hypothetical protein IPJ16_02210 [Bacteroidales bacterium]|nr:hypothetical protein [Bacteroidales bacterium]
MDINKEYLIYNYRPLCFLIFAVVSLIFPFIIVVSGWLDLITTLVVFGLCSISGIFLAKLGLQPIKIIFTNNKIRLEYLSRDLQTIKKAKEALFQNISEYSDYVPGPGLKLTLYFKNHMTFQLYKHAHFNRNDDFEKLLADFRSISELSEKSNSNLSATFPKYFNYDTSKDAKFWIYVSILFIITIIIISVMTMKYGLLIILIIPIGYLFRYFLENKK